MKVWRVQPIGDEKAPWYYDASITSLALTIEDGAEAGSGYEVECVEMTEEEYDALPEFEGW